MATETLLSGQVLASKDRALAAAARRCVSEALDRPHAQSLQLVSHDKSVPAVELPPAVLQLIGQVLGVMSEGKAFSLIPANQEFTTVEAANFLNVSRPFVIKEIEAGRLPHRKVGTHRRIALEDLQQYAAHMRRAQESALEQLAANTRELGLDY